MVASAGEPLSEASSWRRVAPEPGMPASLATVHPVTPNRPRRWPSPPRDAPSGLLHIWGSELSPHDQELLRTFANHDGPRPRAGAAAGTGRCAPSSLEEVDRLQRALVGAVSHDLRTPLATIKASASTLRDADADVSATRPPRVVGSSSTSQADRLDRLVTNLLDVPRVQAGALELRRTSRSVSSIS